MSYVPPHKRHHKKSDGGAASSPPSPSLPPNSVIPRSQRSQNFKSESRPKTSITYAERAMSKWFSVGLVDQSMLSSLTRLEPISVEGRPAVTLVLTENGDAAPEFSKNPWVIVAETVKQDFILALRQLKDVITDFGGGPIQPHLLKDVSPGCGIKLLKPYLVVRLGKVLFHGNGQHTMESLKGSSLPESTLQQLHRSLWTNIPPSGMKHLSKMSPELGEEKVTYLLKILDNALPGAILSCKCVVGTDTNRLQLQKIEVRRLRHLVADVSCIDKNVDLRVQLLCKRRLLLVEDKDLEKIKTLIGYALLDSEVKGGLRWPVGKLSFDQYTVTFFCRTNSRMFKNSSMELIFRQVDRYDLQNSLGEVASEVYIKMPGIVSELAEETFNPDRAFETMKENLEFIWKNLMY